MIVTQRPELVVDAWWDDDESLLEKIKVLPPPFCNMQTISPDGMEDA